MLTLDQKITVLNHLMPDCSRIIEGGEIIWLDHRPMPTDAEMEAQWEGIRLHLAKARKTAEIKERESFENTQGYEWLFNGTTPDIIGTANLMEVLAITGRGLRGLLQLNRSMVEPIRINAQSGIQYYVDPNEAIDISLTGYDFYESITLRSHFLQLLITNTTTVEAVDSIDWDTPI